MHEQLLLQNVWPPNSQVDNETTASLTCHMAECTQYCSLAQNAKLIQQRSSVIAFLVPARVWIEAPSRTEVQGRPGDYSLHANHEPETHFGYQWFARHSTHNLEYPSVSGRDQPFLPYESAPRSSRKLASRISCNRVRRDGVSHRLPSQGAKELPVHRPSQHAKQWLFLAWPYQ